MKRYHPPKGSGKKALSDHVIHRAAGIREKYELGSPATITPEMLGAMLIDPDVARFPTELKFSSDIEEGLFGYCNQTLSV